MVSARHRHDFVAALIVRHGEAAAPGDQSPGKVTSWMEPYAADSPPPARRDGPFLV
jgi:hypothetical protein